MGQSPVFPSGSSSGAIPAASACQILDGRWTGQQGLLLPIWFIDGPSWQYCKCKCCQFQTPDTCKFISHRCFFRRQDSPALSRPEPDQVQNNKLVTRTRTQYSALSLPAPLPLTSGAIGFGTKMASSARQSTVVEPRSRDHSVNSGQGFQGKQ